MSKYVRDMNPQELRAHVKRLQAMPGWHDPLTDSLYNEIKRLDGLLDFHKKATPLDPQMAIDAWNTRAKPEHGEG